MHGQPSSGSQVPPFRYVALFLVPSIFVFLGSVSPGLLDDSSVATGFISVARAQDGVPTTRTAVSVPASLGDEWPEGAKEIAQDALRKSEADPVGACFALTDLLKADREGEKAPMGTRKPDRLLSTAQRAWLSEAVGRIRPRAMDELLRDFQAGKERSDARAALMAFLAMRKSEDAGRDVPDNEGKVGALLAKAKSILGSKEFPEASALLLKMIKGKTDAPEVWQVKPLKVTRIRGEYEGRFLGYNGTVTIKPQEGREIVRVQGKVTNVSPASDPPYAVRATANSLTSLTKVEDADWWLYLEKEKQEAGKKALAENRPARLLTFDMVYLIEDEGPAHPCRYVLDGCNVLEGRFSLIIKMLILFQKDRPEIKNASAFWYGSYVRQGTEAEFDVLFETPVGKKELRLFVLGSRPVALPPESDKGEKKDGP